MADGHLLLQHERISCRAKMEGSQLVLGREKRRAGVPAGNDEEASNPDSCGSANMAGCIPLVSLDRNCAEERNCAVNYTLLHNLWVTLPENNL